MEKLKQIYEGKAKKLYETRDADLLIQEFKDDATAFDAAKRGTIMNKGVMENAAFHNYMIPTTRDLPDLESIIVEHPNELGPFGAKGIGEPPLLGTAPAIRNALWDALGFKINAIPLTARRVLMEIRKNAGNSAQQ